MIKAVVFDLDGVYFETGTEDFISALMQEYEIEEEKIKDVYFRSDEMQSLKRGLISSEEFWEYTIEAWSIEADRDDIIELLIQSYAENANTVKLVRSLKKKGIKIAACTNNFKDRLEGLTEEFSLDEVFDVIITSYEEGITKPDPKIYDRLQEELRFQPKEILVVDDQQQNIDQLEELGFRALKFQSIDRLRDFLNSEGVEL